MQRKIRYSKYDLPKILVLSYPDPYDMDSSGSGSGKMGKE